MCLNLKLGSLRGQSRRNLSQHKMPSTKEKYREFCDFRRGWAVPSRKKVKDRAAIGAKFPTPASREFLHGYRERYRGIRQIRAENSEARGLRGGAQQVYATSYPSALYPARRLSAILARTGSRASM